MAKKRAKKADIEPLESLVDVPEFDPLDYRDQIGMSCPLVDRGHLR